MKTSTTRALVLTIALSAAPVSAQPKAGVVRPRPGVPPGQRPGFRRWTPPAANLPARPVQPVPPGYGYGWQPWLNRGWVNTVGIVPGNVYVSPNYTEPPARWDRPADVNVDPPPAVTPETTEPVRPKVVELDPQTGRFENVDLQDWTPSKRGDAHTPPPPAGNVDYRNQTSDLARWDAATTD